MMIITHQSYPPISHLMMAWHCIEPRHMPILFTLIFHAQLGANNKPSIISSQPLWPTFFCCRSFCRGMMAVGARCDRLPGTRHTCLRGCAWPRMVCTPVLGPSRATPEKRLKQLIKYGHGLLFTLLWFISPVPSRIMWFIYPYPSGLLHGHQGNSMIAPVPMK